MSAQDGSTCHDYCSPGQEHLWGHISQLVPFQLVPEVFLPIAQTFNEDDDDDGGDDDDDDGDDNDGHVDNGHDGDNDWHTRN